MRLLIACSFVFIFLFGNSQDNLFSLKSANVNHLNPALVGTQSDAAVILQYRNQWPTLPGNNTYTSLLSSYNINDQLGVGLEFSDDRIGDGLRNTVFAKANVNCAFNKKKVKTRVGLNLGYRQSALDPSIGFINPTPEHLLVDPSQVVIIDFGAVSEYKNIVLGLSAMQFNEPNISIWSNGVSNLPVRWVALLGYSRSFGDFNLAGISTFQNQQGFSSAAAQFTGQYKFARLGIGVRSSIGEFSSNEWMIASAGIQFDKFSVSYNYDAYFIPERENAGTHEASVAWYIKGLKKEDNISAFVNGIL